MSRVVTPSSLTIFRGSSDDPTITRRWVVLVDTSTLVRLEAGVVDGFPLTEEENQKALLWVQEDLRVVRRVTVSISKEILVAAVRSDDLYSIATLAIREYEARAATDREPPVRVQFTESAGA